MSKGWCICGKSTSQRQSPQEHGKWTHGQCNNNCNIYKCNLIFVLHINASVLYLLATHVLHIHIPFMLVQNNSSYPSRPIGNCTIKSITVYRAHSVPSNIHIWVLHCRLICKSILVQLICIVHMCAKKNQQRTITLTYLTDPRLMEKTFESDYILNALKSVRCEYATFANVWILKNNFKIKLLFNQNLLNARKYIISIWLPEKRKRIK